jgi:hypothetical protein
MKTSHPHLGVAMLMLAFVVGLQLTRASEGIHLKKSSPISLAVSENLRSTRRARCRGVDVRPGRDLAKVAAARPAGTTFCLSSGTFELTKTAEWESGDRVIGLDPRKTLIRPSGAGVPLIAFQVSGESGTIRFSRIDIGGFAASAGADCAQCGTAFKAIVSFGGTLAVSRVRCHQNGTVCLAAQTGNIRAKRLNCFGNGFHAGSLMDPTTRSASCVKMFGGSLTLRSSFIHDNPWNGVWCDHCDHTTWVIEDNEFEHNGHTAIQWEISGGLDTDTALVQNNVIRDNGWQTSAPGSFTAAGLSVTGGRNITVEDNRFRRNRFADSSGSSALSCCRAVVIYDDDRAPWDPNLQNIVITNNDVNTDTIVGCDLSGVTCSGNH